MNYNYFKVCITALLLLCNTMLSAHTFVTDGVAYLVLDNVTNTVEVTHGPLYGGNVAIPETVTNNGITYNVTSIGNGAFARCLQLADVYVPASVSRIGNNAFYESSLKSITICGALKGIGEYAFYCCNTLAAVHISDLAAWCGIDFGNAYSNPLYYAKNLYLDKEKVSSIVISGGATKIKDYAFYGCKCVTSVTIPCSVTSIGNYAFKCCTSLKELFIEDCETTLSLGYNSYNPSNVGTGDGLFDDCPLETLYLGRNLSYDTSSAAGYSPFYYKNVLESVTIGHSVTAINDKLFYDCKRLKNITIPTSVTTIGYGAFYRCTGLTSIIIPKSVIAIGNSAFYGCTSLASVVMNDGVASIGEWAFSYCKRLTDVTIPNSVTCIGDYAFYTCSAMTAVTIGRNVASIGDYVFYYCDALTDVYAMPIGAVQITEHAFSNYSGTLYIPAASKKAYRVAKNWKDFENIEYMQPAK